MQLKECDITHLVQHIFWQRTFVKVVMNLPVVKKFVEYIISYNLPKKSPLNIINIHIYFEYIKRLDIFIFEGLLCCSKAVKLPGILQHRPKGLNYRSQASNDRELQASAPNATKEEKTENIIEH
jgi:hypothetical protein